VTSIYLLVQVALPAVYQGWRVSFWHHVLAKARLRGRQWFSGNDFIITPMNKPDYQSGRGTPMLCGDCGQP
jgi:hypothetical protein